MLNSVYVYFITNGGSFVIPFINKDKASQSWELWTHYHRNTIEIPTTRSKPYSSEYA